jgi:hypothetical protein
MLNKQSEKTFQRKSNMIRIWFLHCFCSVLFARETNRSSETTFSEKDNFSETTSKWKAVLVNNSLKESTFSKKYHFIEKTVLIWQLYVFLHWLCFKSIIRNPRFCAVCLVMLKRNQCFFTVFFGYDLKKIIGKQFGLHLFCLVMLNGHVGNQCFCTVVFWLWLKQHYRKPMCLRRFVWLCSKRMLETSVFAQFCFLVMI